MSQFLRDETINNVSLNQQAISKIAEDLNEIAQKINQDIEKKYSDNQTEIQKRLLLPSYIIRFDGKGFRLFNFENVMKYFQDAHRVERLIFVLDSMESINKISGKNVEISFDISNIDNCRMVVQDDDVNWMDATFYKLKERINKYRNKNILIRNRWTPFAIQLLGVFSGILISFWMANMLSLKLNIENSFVFSFIITLIIFSNVWTIIYELILKCISYNFPNISFKESKGIHWLIKALISTIFVGFFIALFNKLLAYISLSIKAIMK